MCLDEYFGEWLKVIDKQELYKVTKEINNLYRTQQCEPAYNDIFKAFHITPYNNLVLVSLAQDPYFQPNVSTGVCFANKKDVVKLSPSLEILKEAIIDFEVPHNLITFDPTLEEVSKQGVLFLNSALTVRTNHPNSHTYLWRPFISSLLRNLSTYNPGVIYILWGSVAKSFSSFIDNRNVIFKMPHPAYYARTNTKIPHSFFVEVDKVIYDRFGIKIKWFKEENFNYE